MDRTRRRAARHDHDHPRRDHRQHRDPDLAGRPQGRVVRGHLVGRHRLHARAGRGHPDGRLGERSLRYQAPVSRDHRALHARVDGVRRGAEPSRAGHLPRPAGTRWRHADADRHDHHHACGRTPEYGTRHGHIRNPDAPRAGCRPRARWLVRAGLLVAIDLLCQRSDRSHRICVGLALPHRVRTGLTACVSTRSAF